MLRNFSSMRLVLKNLQVCYSLKGKNMTKCFICIRELFNNQSIEGYVEGTIYEIFLCKNC